MSNTQPLLESRLMSEEEAAIESRLHEMEMQIEAQRKELSDLRKTFGAFFSSMKSIFSGAPGSSASAPSVDKSKWDFLGKKIGGKAPEIIEMLLAQPEMTVTQLHKAVRCNYETARYTVRKMREAGILTTNGSAVSLKS
jgi:hypothetical protein